MTNLPFFVYGTLRPGQANHARLLAGRTVAEFGATLGDHAIYGPGLPYVVGEEGSVVVGDLIFIDPDHYDEVLASLDRLEGYRPGSWHSHYERTAVVVHHAGPDGTEMTSVAWVYLAGPSVAERLAPAERIVSGDWLDARLSVSGR